MKITKVVKSILSAVFLLTMLNYTLPAGAQNRAFITEATYYMGEGETVEVARERALVAAKRKANTQISVFLTDWANRNTVSLTQEESVSLAVSLMKVTLLDCKYDTTVPGTCKIWVKLSSAIETDDIGTKIPAIWEVTAANSFNDVQAEYTILQEELKALQDKLAQAVTSEEKQAILSAIRQNEQQFLAIQWYVKGYEYDADKHDCVQAIDAYRQSIALHPHNAKVHTNLGNLYFAQGHYEEARCEYETAIKLNPQEALPYYNCGNIYLEQKRYDLAIQSYDQAIEINPNFVLAYLNRGYIYKAQQQYDLAIRDYSQAIALKPQDGMNYFSRGNVYKSNKQYELAVADYQTASQLRPTDSDIYYNLAISLKYLGRKAEAKQAYQLFLQYAPANDPDLETAKQWIVKLGGTAY